MEDLISVVITTYKRPLSILSRAIESVLKQTYTKLELLVINDAPEEKSLANSIHEHILSLNDSRVIYIEHDKNRGANVARNTGLSRANGTYIAYLDDDDEWSSQKLEIQVACMDHDVALVYGSFTILKDVGDPEIVSQKVDDPLQSILESNFIGSTSFPLLRTSAVKSVGGFDDNLASCQEYDLWIRLILEHRIVYTPSNLGFYYYSNDSTFKNAPKYIAGIESIVNKYKDIYKAHPRQYSNRLNNIAFTLIKYKKIIKALKYKRRAFITDWKNPNNLLVVSYLKRKRKKS